MAILSIFAQFWLFSIKFIWQNLIGYIILNIKFGLWESQIANFGEFFKYFTKLES